MHLCFDTSRWARIVLVLGTLAFLGTRLFLTVAPALNGALSMQPDDAYAYIVKSELMYSCLAKECPALVDLQQHLSRPKKDMAKNIGRFRAYGRAIFQYHPLYSVLLLPLRGMGLSWEQAFNAISIAAAVLVSACIGFFLYAVWGAGAAGVGLFWIAFVFIPGHGLQTMAPTTIVAALALGTWGAVIRQGPGRAWAVFVGAVLMLLMHPLGIVYGAMALALFLWLEPRPWLASTWWWASGCAAVLVLYAFRTLLTSHPAFNFAPFPLADSRAALGIIMENWQTAPAIVVSWLKEFGHPVAAFVIAAIGFALTPVSRRRAVIGIGVLVAASLAASLFHVLPSYSAETFKRVGVFAVVLIAGALGQAFWVWATMIAKTVLSYSRGTRVPGVSSDLPRLSSNAVAAMLIGGFIMPLLVATTLWRGVHSIEEFNAVSLLNNRPLLVDPDQVARMLRDSNDSDAVLYDRQVTMFAYFIQGAYRRGAVLYTEAAGSNLQKDWLDDNPSMRFVVFQNPLRAYPLTLGGEGRVEIFRGESAFPGRVIIKLANVGAQATAQIEMFGADSSLVAVVDLNLPAHTEGWYPISLPEGMSVDLLKLALRDQSAKAYIRGLRFDEESSLNWPWNSSIRVRWKYPDRRIGIRERLLRPPPLLSHRCGGVNVIDDSGDVVLAEKIC